MPGFEKFVPLMRKPGNYKTGKPCLYINSLDDVDQKVFVRLRKDMVKEMGRPYPVKK